MSRGLEPEAHGGKGKPVPPSTHSVNRSSLSLQMGESSSGLGRVVPPTLATLWVTFVVWEASRFPAGDRFAG